MPWYKSKIHYDNHCLQLDSLFGDLDNSHSDCVEQLSRQLYLNQIIRLSLEFIYSANHAPYLFDYTTTENIHKA